MNKCCPICRRYFSSNKNNVKYCSKDCQSKRDICRTKYNFTCLNCKSIFNRRKKSDRVHKFCSYKCSVEYKTYSESQMKEHQCIICDNSFYRLPGDSNPNLMCSKRCQLIHVGSKKRYYTEEIFEKILIENNIDYVIQYQYAKYFSDFYLPKYNLLLELDGKTFHRGYDLEARDMMKAEIANDLGYNMIRIWCSRKADVLRLKTTASKLIGEDLADFISAIPNGMINSVNLIEGVVKTANGENHTTGNAVPSLNRNVFEGVETRIEPNDYI